MKGFPQYYRQENNKYNKSKVEQINRLEIAGPRGGERPMVNHPGYWPKDAKAPWLVSPEGLSFEPVPPIL